MIAALDFLGERTRIFSAGLNVFWYQLERINFLLFSHLLRPPSSFWPSLWTEIKGESSYAEKFQIYDTRTFCIIWEFVTLASLTFSRAYPWGGGADSWLRRAWLLWWLGMRASIFTLVENRLCKITEHLKLRHFQIGLFLTFLARTSGSPADRLQSLRKKLANSRSLCRDRWKNAAGSFDFSTSFPEWTRLFQRTWI